MSAKTVMFDPQVTESGDNGDGRGAARGGVAGEGGGAAGGDVTLTAAENKKLRQQKMNQLRKLGSTKSPSQKRGRGGLILSTLA